MITRLLSRLALILILACVAGAGFFWLHNLPVKSQLTVQASASPVLSSDLSSLPDPALTTVRNFYAAYQERDPLRLGTLFTADGNADDQATRAHLFASSESFSTADVASDYVVLDTAAQGDGWLLTVQEQRVDGKGGALPTRLTQLLLVPSPDAPWAVERYSLIGSASKYEGFLIE